MSVIIRLQGLPLSAGAMDIRNFFKGISLPSGRVHIFGGDTGDAFIAFTSEEDARQAMMLNMGYIGDGQIFLSLSCPAEMRRRIEEVKINSSASSTQSAPAQQALLAAKPQQLTLQQDPILGDGVQIQPSEPSEPFSVQDPKDRKSYPPASSLVHKINLRDPRLAKPDINPSIYQQNRERRVSIASDQESYPQRIDQSRRPPLRPMHLGNTPDLDASRPLRRELFEGSTLPGQDHLYEIPCGRMDRGNLIHGPQRIRDIDGQMDVHSQNRSDISALGWSFISTQQTDIQLHAAGPDVPQVRRMDGPHPNRKVYPPSGPEAFENSKAPFPDECVPGPGRSPWMGMGFREQLPNMRLPRRSRSPSLMNSFGASERFPSPDIRPTLDKGNYFGRPVGPQPFGPTEARGTKRPHPDESGQVPPQTGIAKRIKTTTRYH